MRSTLVRFGACAFVVFVYGQYSFDFAGGMPLAGRIRAGGPLLGSMQLTQPSVTLAESVTTVGENPTAVNATITLTTPGGGPLTSAVTVNFHTLRGTASQEVDYRHVEGAVTFGVGETSGAARVIAIEIRSDAEDEHDETLEFILSSAVGAQLSGIQTQVITVIDDDPPPTLSILDSATIEANSGRWRLGFKVTLSAPSGKIVTVAALTADGTATAPADYTSLAWQVVEFFPGNTMQSVGVDVAGDTLREIDESFTVTLTAPSYATIARGTATGTIRDNDRPAAPFTSDFNTDGTPDLLWRHDTTIDLAVWLMSGMTMTIIAGPTPNQGAVGQEVVGTGDFYRDGSADIVWRDTSTGHVSIWIMSGLNRLWIEELSPQIEDAHWRPVAVADINNDHHPDLIWHHADGRVAVSMLVGRRIVALHLLTSGVMPPNWHVVATGDMDQDGYIDLVWQNDMTGALGWWRLDGNVYVSSGPLAPGLVPDVQWKIRGGADLDRDGMTDLLWQNAVTGEVALWLMNATSLRSSVPMTRGPLTDLGWQLIAPK